MRDGSLRYGLSGGVGAALAGVLSLVIGGIIAPIGSHTTSADQVVVAVTIRALFAYVGLFAALGLAAYAGGLAERRRLTLETQEISDHIAVAGSNGVARPTSGDQLGSAITGAIVMLCYWFVTTIFAYVFPATPAPTGVKSNGFQTAVEHAVYGLVLVLLGAGFGVFGSRTAFTRRMMSRIVIAPKPALLLEPEPSADGVAPSQPAPEPAETANPSSAAPE